MEDIQMLNTRSHFAKPLIAAIVGAGTLIAVPATYATSNGLADWRDTYPNSNSDDSGCQLCHGSSTNQLNAYGRDICLKFAENGAQPADWNQTFLDIEPLDSDMDGSSNGLEIANDTQPGWTSGGNNPLYIADFTQGCAQIAMDSTVPNSVPLPYDIATTGDPIANPNGPYEALVGESITFDGSGSTDDGNIVQYDWSFGDGAVTLDAGPNPEHTYNADGIYNVVLTVTDNDGNTNAAGTTATISPVELLDLDINTLKVSKNVQVGKPISIELRVENNGTVLGQAIATVVGMQNDIEVFRLRLNVFDDIGRGTTTFDFGSYVPTVPGDIIWSADIADGDPDNDEVTAITTVR
jgi:hypothetical protein